MLATVRYGGLLARSQGCAGILACSSCPRWKMDELLCLSWLPYLREPRRRFFNAACRRLTLERLGLVMRNVPLPRYSA